MLPLRIVFLGSDPIALPMLDWLADRGAGTGKIVAVFTQPDRAVGRGQRVKANPIKAWAHAHAVPVFQPERLTSEVRIELDRIGADLSLVMAYGHILRDEFIDAPRLGTVNLHASLLPKYRGASPIQAAIAGLESETGVAFMRIVRKLDAGPVADAERVPIEPLDTASDVERKLAAACVPLLARSLPRLAEGTLRFVPQDEGAATFCGKLRTEDGVLDFSAPAPVLAARINGMFPWPGCRVEIEGTTVKLGLADAVEEEPETTGAATPAGVVVGADRLGLLVRAGSGMLRIRRLQRPGGRVLAAAEFLRGFRVDAGTKIPSHAMRPLAASNR